MIDSVYDAHPSGGRRIRKDTYLGGILDNVEHFYYTGWSNIETRNGSDQVTQQHVWDSLAPGSGHYIDSLAQVANNTNPGTDNTCDQKLYVLQDQQFNVLALTDDAGDIVERYEYTLYGERTVMNASFVVLHKSAYSQQMGFQGLRHDDESGLIQNRNRMLDPGTGRFIQRDPHPDMYPDGLNAYAAYHVMWGGVDPWGMYSVAQWWADLQEGAVGVWDHWANGDAAGLEPDPTLADSLRSMATNVGGYIKETLSPLGDPIKAQLSTQYNSALEMAKAAAIKAINGTTVSWQEEIRKDLYLSKARRFKGTVGAGYRIKVPEMQGNECCARIMIFGFAQGEGAFPVKQLFGADLMVRVNGRLGYEFVFCPFSTDPTLGKVRDGDGATFTVSASAGLRWELGRENSLVGLYKFEVTVHAHWCFVVV